MFHLAQQKSARAVNSINLERTAHVRLWGTNNESADRLEANGPSSEAKRKKTSTRAEYFP